MHKGRDLTQVPLSERRALLRTVLKPSEHVALSEVSDRTAAEMLKFVKSHGLEGVVAKRSDSVYQPGLRTGLWRKHRINLGQEFVIGGYTPGTHGFDALIVGFYRGRELIYAARVRAGLVPATRRAVFEKVKHLKAAKYPFANLPELSEGRWGAGLTAEKMKECVWLLCRMRHSSQTHSFIFSAVRPAPHRPSESSGRFAKGHFAALRCLILSNTDRRVAGTRPARTRAA